MIKKSGLPEKKRTTNQKQQKIYGAKRMTFSKHSRKMNSKKVTGQGMSEYLIIVGLIAVAGIAAMGFMGSSVRMQLTGMAEELTGGDGSGTQGAANAQAVTATGEATDTKSLGEYGGQNNRL